MKTNIGARLLLPIVGIATGVVLWTGYDAQAKVDVVSAASLSVRADSIKTTSVIIAYFNDRYNYGSRTLCYIVAPGTPANGTCAVKTASGTSGTFKVSGLTPSTSYNYSVKAINTRDTQDPPYTTSGSFKTLALPIDTLPIDTLPTDTIPIDTLPTDTIPTDTLPTDTIPTDTIPVDTTTTSLRAPYHGLLLRNPEISAGYDLQGRRIPAGRHTAAGPWIAEKKPQEKRPTRKADTP